MSVKLGLYKHKNGNLYQVIGVGRHSETLEELVIYQALYAGYGCWVRPLAMFEEQVVDDEGCTRPRFAYVGPGVGELPTLR